MAPSTTALESRSNPTLRQSTGSQRIVPALTAAPVPVKDQEARPPDVALRCTVQTSYSSVRTSAYALPNPLGAGYARSTTQNSPSVTDTDRTDADGSEVVNNVASARTTHAPAGPIPHVLRERSRNRTRNLQFLDLARSDPPSNTTMPVASPHKRAQGKRRKWMEPALWIWFRPFIASEGANPSSRRIWQIFSS
jgi:hypothetical protein